MTEKLTEQLAEQLTGASALTDVELRVAELAAQGTPVAVIAEVLGVSANTAARHLTAVYVKLRNA
ncbi:regulatory LuxR family protein [Amycolatopsis echigonensis]|uniref:Regulatory LuxR family protein n=1 Tax=Amycolatopsis echigonensis TaxID=2576905 RepID=A0A2N3WMF2_9PSEU|nr:LuxR C-terminal-related transcriptional regulator [Amycolatopsis niigatensis]PKV95051.1 regulatory LuxR family protein [Amycolatopsis niigatensis]